MKLTINNRAEELQADQLTVKEILQIKNYTFPRVVVKLNGKLIKKPEFEQATVKEGDVLEVIHLISGG